jgi:uncharacterized protein (TIGR02268 family)
MPRGPPRGIGARLLLWYGTTSEVALRVPHSVYWLLLVTLLRTSAAAAQQPTPPPILRQKFVTLPASVQDATVRVARGTLTTLTFDSALASKGVQLTGRDTHFERIVVEERTLTLKPKVELAPGERLVLTVRFADSAAPQEATFELVPGAGEVDAQVEVVHGVLGADALKAELASTQAQLAALQARCGDNGPESAVLSGWLLPELRGQRFFPRAPPDDSSGLKVVVDAHGYRTSTWALLMVRLRNLPGGRPWGPGSVRLLTAGGAPVRVLSARLDKPQVTAGEEGLLLVRTGVPWWEETEELLLELKDREGGRPLLLSGVKF